LVQVADIRSLLCSVLKSSEPKNGKKYDNKERLLLLFANALDCACRNCGRSWGVTTLGIRQ
jgi:hypothetical protein